MAKSRIMKRCVTGKRVYHSEQLAEDALIEAHIHFEYRTGGGPKAVYRCEDCGDYHLTSRNPMNPRLAQSLASGTIKKQKEASRWQSKFKL
jgi:ABC-type ATPase with predicted acetyltransferase domain